MGQAAHHYLIFETAGGFCGIAWNDAGITRFQLPTKSAEATERVLLRRTLGAKPGAPRPEVAEAVAAASAISRARRRIFPVSGSTSPSRTRSSNASTRRLDGSGGAAQRHTVPWRRNSGPDRKPRVMLARPWRGIRWPFSSLATGSWRLAAKLVVFLRPAARRPRDACSRWRAFTSGQRHRHSNLSDFKFKQYLRRRRT